MDSEEEHHDSEENVNDDDNENSDENDNDHVDEESDNEEAEQENSNEQDDENKMEIEDKSIPKESIIVIEDDSDADDGDKEASSSSVGVAATVSSSETNENEGKSKSNENLKKRAFDEASNVDSSAPSAKVAASQPAKIVENPELAEKYKEEGNGHYREGRYNEAVRSYTLAIENHPSNATLWNNRAAARMAMDLNNEAIKDLEKSLSLDPNNAKTHFRLGKVLLRIGQFERSKTSYDAGLKFDPKNSTAESERKDAAQNILRVTRVKESINAKNYDQALLFINAALRISPLSPEFLIWKVECLVGTKDLESALNETTSIMKMSGIPPSSLSNLLYWRATILYRQDNFIGAEKHLEQVLRDDPDNTKAASFVKRIRKMERLKNSGNEAYKSRNYEESIKIYTDCLTADPEDPPKGYLAKVHYNRASAYASLGKHEEAVQDCDMAIENDKDYTKAYLRRATSLRALGGKERLERAMYDYKEVERLQGRDQDLAQNMRQLQKEIKAAKRVDYYAILELPQRQNSTDADIKKAYRKSAMKWHPDRHASSGQKEKDEAEKQFKLVAEAYGVLSDPSKKQAYDSGADLDEIENGGGGGGMHHGVDPNDIFRMFFAGGGGGFGGSSGYGPYGSRARYGGGGGFGGGGGHYHQGYGGHHHHGYDDEDEYE